MERNINDLFLHELKALAKESPGHMKGNGDGTVCWVTENVSDL